jgi:hypothetical protein
MKFDELTQPGWGNVADYFPEQDKRNSPTELKVPAVIKSHLDNQAANPAPSKVEEVTESLEIIPGISQMLCGTSRPGSNDLKLTFRSPQSDKCIGSRLPDMEPTSSSTEKAKPIEPVSLYSCISTSS